MLETNLALVALALAVAIARRALEQARQRGYDVGYADGRASLLVPFDRAAH